MDLILLVARHLAWNPCGSYCSMGTFSVIFSTTSYSSGTLLLQCPQPFSLTRCDCSCEVSRQSTPDFSHVVQTDDLPVKTETVLIKVRPYRHFISWSAPRRDGRRDSSNVFFRFFFLEKETLHKPDLDIPSRQRRPHRKSRGSEKKGVIEGVPWDRTRTESRRSRRRLCVVEGLSIDPLSQIERFLSTQISPFFLQFRVLRSEGRE